MKLVWPQDRSRRGGGGHTLISHPKIVQTYLKRKNVNVRGHLLQADVYKYDLI
jgi:hypothetical protein